MTPESSKIATLIDSYPADVRCRILAAVERIMVVYVAHGAAPEAPRPARAMPANVVPLRRLQ